MLGQTPVLLLQFGSYFIQSGTHWAKIKVLTGLCSLCGAIGKNLFPYPFQFLEALPFLDLCSWPSTFVFKPALAGHFSQVTLTPSVSSSLRTLLIILAPPEKSRIIFVVEDWMIITLISSTTLKTSLQSRLEY